MLVNALVSLLLSFRFRCLCDFLCCQYQCKWLPGNDL